MPRKMKTREARMCEMERRKRRRGEKHECLRWREGREEEEEGQKV